MSPDPAAMNPERFATLRRLFDDAIELAPADRVSLLDRLCADDPLLRADVEQLLLAHERADAHWERPVGMALAEALRDETGADQVGRRFGAYELTRLIGVGGMGAVFEAVRADDQYRKRVAIKMLRRGVSGEQAILRFRQERQILATLDHPNITALLDGGVTDDGQPFLVMEYVDGAPLTHWSDAHQLSTSARVTLLRQVCAAVQHAHQSLVVHRDLKPGNILVTSTGVVKLLDFGIARLLRDPMVEHDVTITQQAPPPFTPAYASPEQLRGLPATVATDVYALGIVACELLSGRRPLDTAGLDVTRVRTLVTEAEPTPPSELTGDTDTAAHRGSTPMRLQRELRGDLDAIVLQAIRKEPERRYRSVEQFDADLRRYIDGDAVLARPDSVAYRAGKVWRRRRLELCAALAVVLALVGGLGAARSQARVAEHERDKVEQVNAFLSNILSAADPGYQGRDVTVRAALAQASKNVATARLAPDVEAQIRHTLGQTLYELGEYDSARVHVGRAYALRRSYYGARDQRTTMSLSYVSALAESDGNYVQAESIARVIVGLQRDMPRKQRSNTELATALDNLARTIEYQGRLDDALALKLESIALRRGRTDSASLDALPYTLSAVAVSYQYQQRWASAESLLVEALAVEKRVHGERSPMYGNVLRFYASVLDGQQRAAAADSAIQGSIEVLRASVGTRHPDYIKSVAARAQQRLSANDVPAAVTMSREVAAMIGDALDESQPAASSTLQTLGIALDSLGQFAAADSAHRRSIALRKRHFPADHWAIPAAESAFGYHLALMERYPQAEPLLLSAYTALAQKRGADSSPAKKTAERLALMYTRMGRQRLADGWRAKAE